MTDIATTTPSEWRNRFRHLPSDLRRTLKEIPRSFPLRVLFHAVPVIAFEAGREVERARWTPEQIAMAFNIPLDEVLAGLNSDEDGYK